MRTKALASAALDAMEHALTACSEHGPDHAVCLCMWAALVLMQCVLHTCAAALVAAGVKRAHRDSSQTSPNQTGFGPGMRLYVCDH